jgi:hypothetical protein
VVGMAMTLTVSGIALAALSNAEKGFTRDKGKIEGGQKLSSVLDIIGREIVQAGEQINDPRFPVIKVAPDGVRGSRIIVYRGLEEALSICSAAPSTPTTSFALNAGAAYTSLSLTAPDTTADGIAVRSQNPSCTPVQTFTPVTPATTPATYTTTRTYPLNVQAWRTRRLAAGGTLPFFLHDTQGNIQLVNLTGETNASSFDTVGLTTASFNAAFNFPNRSTVNLLEKREYLICGTELKVRVNNSTEGNCGTTGVLADSAASPFKTVATNVTSMNITWTTAATTTATPDTPRVDLSFPCAPPTVPPTIPALPLCPVITETRDWRDLRGVTVSITAPNPDPYRKDTQPTINASGRFYPRNILSTNAQ